MNMTQRGLEEWVNIAVVHQFVSVSLRLTTVSTVTREIKWELYFYNQVLWFFIHSFITAIKHLRSSIKIIFLLCIPQFLLYFHIFRFDSVSKLPGPLYATYFFSNIAMLCLFCKRNFASPGFDSLSFLYQTFYLLKMTRIWGSDLSLH